MEPCHGSERTPPGPPGFRAQRESLGWVIRGPRTFPGTRDKLVEPRLNGLKQRGNVWGGVPTGPFDRAAPAGRPGRADGWVGKRAGVCSYEAEKHTRGPRIIERSEIVWGGFGRGRAGGFPATPSSTLGRPRTARSFKELFSLCSKAFEPLAVPGAPACFPGSECGVTPLPQFPRPYEPPCKPQPAAARVKFCYLPTRPGWVGSTTPNYPVIVAAQPTPYHPSPQAGVPLGGEHAGHGKQRQLKG